MYNITKNQHLIEDKVNQLIYKINKLSKIDTLFELFGSVNLMAMTCHTVNEILDNLENAIMFAHLNVLHPSIITIDQLKILIESIPNLLPNFNNIQSYYSIASSQLYYKNDKIIISIHFPIIEKDEYNYFKLFPIPKNNLIIVPKKPFLLINPSKEYFMDEECPQVEDMYICRPEDLTSSENCIVKLIKNQQHECKLSPVILRNPIIETINSGHLIVVPTNRTSIQKICKNSGFLNIDQPSLITISENCLFSCIIKNTRISRHGLITNNSIYPTLKF